MIQMTEPRRWAVSFGVVVATVLVVVIAEAKAKAESRGLWPVGAPSGTAADQILAGATRMPSTSQDTI